MSENRNIVIGRTSYPAPGGSMLNQTISQMHMSQQIGMGNAQMMIGGTHASSCMYSGMVKPGSNYSSPRSSVGSGGDSKGSSPRTSLTNPPLLLHMTRDSEVRAPVWPVQGLVYPVHHMNPNYPVRGPVWLGCPE